MTSRSSAPPPSGVQGGRPTTGPLRSEDLDHKELLQLDSTGAVIRFAGHRAILVDTVAMGILRRYIVDNSGLDAARAVLTQFGFAHGWRMAEAMAEQFRWSGDEEWRRAGPKLHSLEGLFTVHADMDPLSTSGVTIGSSYEAEQHLLHFGRADQPVCWTICGLLSGYVSRTERKEIYVLEDECIGRGDTACHLVGRTREEWALERKDELHSFDEKRLEDCLDVSLHRVIESLEAAEKKIREHRRSLVRVVPDLGEPIGIVAKSDAIHTLVDLARRVAKVDSTVLITGESGTGKERVARLLHDESARSSGPFIAVNCGAIAETLLEGELFGHARGAFTGATQERAGLFEAACGGTLLLDEVGEVSPAMQVKLLRALQEREVRRVGENKSRKIDVRIIAATNRDLELGVEDGSFRRDLYFRLKVVELKVPPLRQRKEDMLPLARILLADAARQMRRDVSGIAPSAAEQLRRYAWPGNVRELQNTMERAVALARGNRVELEDLPDEIRQASPRRMGQTGDVRSLDAVEKDYILAALDLNGGNQTRTAGQLGIGTATLYRKLKSYGLIGTKPGVRKGIP